MDPDEFWDLAQGKGFVKKGRVVAKHADILRWLKSDIGLGHVHSNFVILYIRLRAGGEGVTPHMEGWARSTGYSQFRNKGSTG